jgi:hypothetical protein
LVLLFVGKNEASLVFAGYQENSGYTSPYRQQMQPIQSSSAEKQARAGVLRMADGSSRNLENVTFHRSMLALFPGVFSFHFSLAAML